MNKKIKILRILNRFCLGGPVHNAVNLSKYIDSDRYDTFLIGGIAEPHEISSEYILDKSGINYRKLKYMRRAISPFYDFIVFIQILRIIFKFKPDIIHTHAAKAGLLGRFAGFLYFRNVKIVHTYHGNVFEGYFSPLKNKIILFIERFLAKKSTKIIAISNLQKNDLLNKYRICNEEKIVVVPLGFDLSKFTENNLEKRNKIRNEFLVEDYELLITIIGRVVPIKNHRLFIDAFIYCKEKSNIKIKGLIVGDGSKTKDIINYANKKGMLTSYKTISRKNIDFIFSSWRSDIDSILAASDVVCLTSINEGTPVSIIESMASATASISTNVGGVSDIIENNISGIVCSMEVNDYGENLLKMIEDHDLRHKLAKNGKNISLENFNYNKLVFNIESLYQKII